jgi:hypothetical protein
MVSFLPLGHAEYAIIVAAYNQTSETVLNLSFDVDGSPYGTTPEGVYEAGSASHYLNIDMDDGAGGNFQGWLYDGNLYIDNTFWLYDGMGFDGKTVTAIYSSSPSPPNGTSGVGNYTFYGLNDEFGGSFLNSSIYVTAKYSVAGMPPERFLLNGQYGYNTSIAPYAFHFELGDNDREYWLSSNENNVSIYVFNSTLTTYTINFFDTGGITTSETYVSAKTYINGSLTTVEKRKVDITKSITMNLMLGSTYQIVLEKPDATYIFGDLLMTAQTFVQLTLRGVDFPKETLLTQKYIHAYAIRNGTLIQTVFYDTQGQITTKTVTISYTDFTTVYTITGPGNYTIVNWGSALENVTYIVTVTAQHPIYGTLTFKQILPGDFSVATPPFDLSWLGIWGFDSSMLIPACIILFAAGCFSALNAEVGAILMCIAAIALTAMGWISIPIGSLVAATSLAILMALVYHKRRGGYGG